MTRVALMNKRPDADSYYDGLGFHACVVSVEGIFQKIVRLLDNFRVTGWTSCNHLCSLSSTLEHRDAESVGLRQVGLAWVGECTTLWPAVMDTGSKSELLEHPNGVPVEIKFIPLQPVPGRNRVGVMVVMPAISEAHQRHPPIVG